MRRTGIWRPQPPISPIGRDHCRNLLLTYLLDPIVHIKRNVAYDFIYSSTKDPNALKLSKWFTTACSFPSFGAEPLLTSVLTVGAGTSPVALRPPLRVNVPMALAKNDFRRSLVGLVGDMTEAVPFDG